MTRQLQLQMDPDNLSRKNEMTWRDGAGPELELAEAGRLELLLRHESDLWNSGLSRIAGVDEAGVGPLAGPVVAAAVIFHPGTRIPGVDDSKRLTSECRYRLAELIQAEALAIGVGQASVEEIAALNVYHAALLAMKRAVDSLSDQPQHLLVDGRRIPGCAFAQTRIIGGDRISFSIAAASIVAKTHRDNLMRELDQLFPQYGFAQHKGYPTRAHQDALRRFGPSPVHRYSFEFVRELCGEYSEEFYELSGALEKAQTDRALERVEARVWSEGTRLSRREKCKLSLILKRRRSAG